MKSRVPPQINSGGLNAIQEFDEKYQDSEEPSVYNLQLEDLDVTQPTQSYQMFDSYQQR